MSETNNDYIKSRALEALGDYPSKYTGEALYRAIQNNDLDEMQRLTLAVERANKSDMWSEAGDTY